MEAGNLEGHSSFVLRYSSDEAQAPTRANSSAVTVWGRADHLSDLSGAGGVAREVVCGLEEGGL